jgi:hypothetical protein
MGYQRNIQSFSLALKILTAQFIFQSGELSGSLDVRVDMGPLAQ